MATTKLYGPLIGNLFAKTVNWSTDDIRVMLVTSSYTPDQDTHSFLSSVTGEATGTGYTAGGQALTSKTQSYDGSTNTLTLDAADVTWANSTITARYAVIYDNTGAAAGSKPLVAFLDFGSDVASTAGNFVIEWDATGIIKATVA